MVLNMRNIVDKTILHSSIDNDTRLKLLECVRLFNDIRTAEGNPYDSRCGHIKENGKVGVITSEDFQTFLPQEYETIIVNTISNIVKEYVETSPLLSTFKKNFLVATVATLGVILGAAYMLWLAKRVIFGVVKNSEIKSLNDLNILEGIILFLLAISTIFFGFYPQLLLDTMNVSVNYLIQNYEADLAVNTLISNDK